MGYNFEKLLKIFGILFAYIWCVTVDLDILKEQIMNSNILKSLIVTSSFLTTTAAFSDDHLETAPTPPKLQTEKAAKIKRQVGVGSNTAYAQAGVVEIGGALNYSSTESRTSAGLSPFVGYFISDNLQLSALTNYTYNEVEREILTDAGIRKDKVDSSSGSLVLEPSLHTPISRTQFLFGGIGLGAYFAEGQETGFAFAPRAGFKSLVGRSGMFTVALQGVYSLSENESESAKVDGTVLSVEDGANISVGYSALL